MPKDYNNKYSDFELSIGKKVHRHHPHSFLSFYLFFLFFFLIIIIKKMW